MNIAVIVYRSTETSRSALVMNIFEVYHIPSVSPLPPYIMSSPFSKISSPKEKLKIEKPSKLSPQKEKMASSPIVFRTRFHARSVSLPSRPHPSLPEYNDILCRIASSGAASSSSSSIRTSLSGLQDLHECIDSLLLLSETQQALAKECHGKWVDDILDGSLRVLDICESTKDSLFLAKEYTQELQSALRRKGSDAKEAAKYIATRKNVTKTIQKTLRNLKGLQTTHKAQDSWITVSMLREVEQVTLSVLESLLSFISGPKDQSIVSKLMKSKSTTEISNEFEQIDDAMKSIVKHKSVDMVSIQGHLADLELSIEDLESGIECLRKGLIKTRVTLLNIVSN